MGWKHVVGMIGGLLLLGWSGGIEQASNCRDSCYAAKSQAYQQCRTIPPSDRDARNRCFRQADAALERCLGRCG